MRALILAAGVGERLRPYTELLPKPMLAVGGKPVLQRNVELLRNAGVREIRMNLHYRADAIRSHFGDGGALGVSITYDYEPELLGTAGAIRNAADFLGDEDSYVVYGDNLSTIDLASLAREHRAKRAVATIALFHRDDPGQSGIVALAADDRVTRFLEKPSVDQIFSHWVNAGYIVIAPTVPASIPAQTPCDLGRDVLPALVDGGLPVFGYRMSERLWWIDTVSDYRRVAAQFPENP